MPVNLKIFCTPAIDLLLKFFNDPFPNGLGGDLSVLPTEITSNPQYVDGIWYLFYTGNAPSNGQGTP